MMMRMDLASAGARMLLGLCLASLALGIQDAPILLAQDPAPVPKPELVLVPGTRVRLAPPAGHQPGRGFLGYQWPETSASLIVIEMPGPYAEASTGFEEKRLAKAGMKLVESSEAKISGRDGRRSS